MALAILALAAAACGGKASGPRPSASSTILATELPSGSAGSEGGQAWTGTMHSDSSAHVPVNPGANCSESWDTTFAVTVGAGGKVNGSGVGHLADVTCPEAKWLQGHATYENFRVVGTFDGHVFKLQFLQTATDGGNPGYLNYSLFLPPLPGSDSQPTIVATVSGAGTASGDVRVTRTVEGIGSATGHHTVSMRCTNCGG